MARLADKLAAYPVRLHPIHKSIRPKGVRLPQNMSRIAIEPEVWDGMQKIAGEIFSDCINVGVPFIEVLAAIYMSGLAHGSSIHNEEE